MYKLINIIFAFINIVLAQQVDYQTQIQPIFNENCTNCHGYSGGLALGNYDQLMSGGNSGDLVIPGDYQNSILWQRIDSGEMPPGGNISNAQLELIETWIMQGALEEILIVNEKNITPDQFTLYQNYPNPFNPTTVINFKIKNEIYISIDIYDLKGNHIKNLLSKKMIAGFHKIKWDSKNKRGLKVPSGVYLSILKSNLFSKSKKMVLLK
ncbi:MAG: c-type cytochrome domain-containing protein [Candidatus Neomarinimicrobiota bacterium]|tara:strand:+ start:317 stop:946 length:630 start_codon:yes stop_codon:yes gene_type:complete